MPAKRPRPSRVSLHVSVSPDVAAKVRAYAGWHGLEISAVVERALKTELKGFGVRQDGPAPTIAGPVAGGAGEGGEAQAANEIRAPIAERIARSSR